MSDPQLGLNEGVSNQKNLISAVLEALPRSLSDNHLTQLQAFIPAYYHNMPEDDLASFNPDDLAGAALSHWQLARLSIAEAPHVLVFNPTFDSHGWQSPHTVIQIVAEDQPWLVASTQAALAREGHTVYHINHPILHVERDEHGQWLDISETASGESLMHIEIDALTDEQQG
ncbi:MAG: glutamate dehydrogenase, partial [Granulosicoccus sp.]